MNYWHMQLHPDNSTTFNTDTIKRLLKEKKIIGLGEWDNDGGKRDQFYNRLTIGDIVAVKNGGEPIALVRVIDNAYFDRNIDDNFDWFPNRRKIEILDFYKDEYNFTIPQPRGTLSICENLDTPTSRIIIDWYKKIKLEQLMENIKLQPERIAQIKSLWDKYKTDFPQTEREKIPQQLDSHINEWSIYRDKIINDTFTLDDYTNTISNSKLSKEAGWYLCNFLERTTSNVLGSSKPGTAGNFEVKLNSDNTTYYIKNDKKDNATKDEAEQFFALNIKPLIKNIVQASRIEDKIELIEKAEYSAEQFLMKMVVLDHLTEFIYIYSSNVLDSLYDEFVALDEYRSLGKNRDVYSVVKQILKIDDTNKSELIILSHFLWKYSTAKAIVDVNNPNAILYGPPGTGKTYSVKNSIDFICQGDSSFYEFLQFHPSFTYEDFIEGIKPKGVSANGNIKFELVNGAFKNFCIKAKKERNKDFYFIVDEINRANLSSVFGETLSLLEKDYRDDGKSNKNLLGTQYSTLIEDLIKEDAKYNDLAYAIDNGKVKFGIPENVFFIGMMNDVDKSIDAFDLALRRRFKWIRKDCDYDVIIEQTRYKDKEPFSNIYKYKKACEGLNTYISKELALGKSYEFGHSFFMKMSGIAKQKTISDDNIIALYNLYLRPTLKEYLRAFCAETELESKLKHALTKFKDSMK